MPADGAPRPVAFEPGGSALRLLACRAAERPGHPFLWVQERGPWTLGGLTTAAASLAVELSNAGVKPKDRVLVRLGNDARFLSALAATWSVGAAAVVMHPAAPPAEVDRVADAFGVTAEIAAGDGGRAPGRAGDSSGSSGGRPADPAGDPPGSSGGRPAGPAGDPPGSSGGRPAGPAGGPSDSSGGRTGSDRPVLLMGEPDLSSLDESVKLPVPDVDSNCDALVLLTSGSTGEPKGVALSHGAVWANLRATVSAFRSDTRPTPIPTEPKPPSLITNPLSHTAGIVRLLFALYVGRSIVLLRKFDARAAHAAVLHHGIDHLTLNPAMLRMLLDGLEPGEDLGKVRYVSSGTAPLPPALREEFEGRFGVPVLQAYGQTEAFGAIAVENVRDVLAGRRRPGSVGRPLTGIEIRIRRPDGTDADTSEQGEIVARTQSVTTGYLGGGDTGSPVDGDGWLHTGDLGHLDADGYLFVTGRLKNLIICGGFNVIPEEVEARLMDDPAVRVAAVVGLPDDRLGEIPVALVEADASAAEILARVADRLAAYKRPRRLFTVEALPRVANGKVDQPAARRLAAALVAAESPTIGAPAAAESPTIGAPGAAESPTIGAPGAVADAAALAPQRISAVAFDMGGVLTHSALGGLDRYGAELGLPAGCLTAYFRGDGRMARLEVGEMTAREFFKHVCVDVEAVHGQRVDIRCLAAAAEEGQVLNPEMIDLVRQLHERATTALVTNNVAEAGWRRTFPFELFDVVVDSSDVGVRKPDPRFYEELLRGLDRPPSEVVFIDDFEENLKPAAELGIATIHFTGIDACRRALTELGVELPASPIAPLSKKERARP